MVWQNMKNIYQNKIKDNLIQQKHVSEQQKNSQAEFLSFFLTYVIYTEILLQLIPCVFFFVIVGTVCCSARRVWKTDEGEGRWGTS